MEQALAGVLGASKVENLRRLSGGASRDTFSFDADGRPLILQRQRVAGLRDFKTESALLRQARNANVPVAEVIVTDDHATDEQRSAIGAAFMVVERLDGETIARKILRDDEFAAARSKLAAQCGEALAGIHSIPVDAVPGLEEADQVAQYRIAHDSLGVPSPAFELGFRWLESNRPPSSATTVVHGDFRLGNLIIDPNGLRAVIDWELGHLGDPMEDLGWLCTKAWRFGNKPRVGGFGDVDDLVAAYEARSGAAIDRDALRWWETLGTLKWGVMCNMQANAHLSGAVRSVELAMIGRRVAEQEHDLLLLLPPSTLGFGDVSTPEVASTRHQSEVSGGMHGRPTAEELVVAVREFLERDVMAQTTGPLQFHARVAVNAMAAVERELRDGPAMADAHAARLAALGFTTEGELADAIRSGSLDDRYDEVAAVVRAAVHDKLAVANPKYLTNPTP